MDFQPARRRFFRAAGAKATQLRPPWALDEAQFLTQCTRCDDCVSACPTHIIERGDGGFPEINFQQGECTFCGDCIVACKPRALRSAPNQEPWHLLATIGPSCLVLNQVICRACGEQCEMSAISFSAQPGGLAPPQIAAELCNGCGACVAGCPVQAVKILQRNDMDSQRGGQL
jgi:ferredoxin-type protein NapF